MKTKKYKPLKWIAKLANLNHLLDQGGLAVGPDIWIRIYDLLIAKQQQRNLPINPKDLQWQISGLVVTSHEQQQQFNILYQQWLDDIGCGTPLLVKQKEQKEAQKTIEKKLQKQQKNNSIWKVFLLAFILLSILTTVAYLKQSEQKKITEVSENTDPIIIPPDNNLKDLEPILVPNNLSPNTQLTLKQTYLLNLFEQVLPFTPAFLLLFWLLGRWLRWKEVLRQQKGNPSDPLNHISIHDATRSLRNKQLYNNPDLSRALRRMHNTQKLPNQQLDINATIEASARAAGYFSPVYQHRLFVPPTLLLISYHHGKDQAAGLAMLIQQRLLKAGLEVYTYLFQGTPQRLLSIDKQRWCSLEELVKNHTKANLLLVSDPDIFLGNWSGKLKPWTKTLTQWQQRGLLYTRIPSSKTLNAFKQLRLQSAPLSSDGLSQISQHFSDAVGVINLPIILTKNTQILPPVLARMNHGDCYVLPEKEEQLLQINALKQFCTLDDLRLLTIIASYPELHWPLTLRLESELFEGYESSELREQRLSRLLRLPWMRYGQIPLWLRQFLHQKQNKDQYQETQHIFKILFLESQINASEGLQLPFNTTTNNQRKSWKRWMKKLRQANSFVGNESVLEDQIFAITLYGNKPFNLDILLPKTMRNKIPKNQWIKILQHILIVLFLSTLLGTLLLQGWQRYGKSYIQNIIINNTVSTEEDPNTEASSLDDKTPSQAPTITNDTGNTDENSNTEVSLLDDKTPSQAPTITNDTGSTDEDPNTEVSSLDDKTPSQSPTITNDIGSIDKDPNTEVSLLDNKTPSQAPTITNDTGSTDEDSNTEVSSLDDKTPSQAPIITKEGKSSLKNKPPGNVNISIGPESADELRAIADLIFQNETGGRIDLLIHWNLREEFASMGIGHFTWYPANKKQRFGNTFPGLLDYLQQNKVGLPTWVQRARFEGAPWNSREELFKVKNTPRILEFSKLLYDTRDLQAKYILDRGMRGMPRLVKSAPAHLETLVANNLNAVANTSAGRYILIDYINFKGEGLNRSGGYKGQNWGLLQVLEEMRPSLVGRQALNEFADAAMRVLERRVRNADPRRNESKWLPGWRNRVNKYRNPFNKT